MYLISRAVISAIISACAIANGANAKSLLEAVSNFPQLSNFTTLLTNYPTLAEGLLTSNYTSLSGPATFLVPSDSAFDKIAVYYDLPIANLTVEQLEPYIQYHLLVGEVTSYNLTAASGITVPTYLSAPQFNNRSAGEALGSTGADGNVHNGQVVFLQAKQDQSSSSNTKRFVVRQLESPTVNVQSGLGHELNLTTVDGIWDGGYFQIVDQIFTLPQNCTDSIRRWNMTAFSDSLARTGLGAPLDITQNVTCFTPNDQAFLQAGSPNEVANLTNVQELVKFHIITEPLYSNFLEDGQIFTTFSNESVRITLRDSDIFVNDAKIITKNVITNNGLMHVLDRVMSPLSASGASSALSTSTAPSRPTNTASVSTVTVTAAPTSTNNAAVQVEAIPWLWTALAVLGSILA